MAQQVLIAYCSRL